MGLLQRLMQSISLLLRVSAVCIRLVQCAGRSPDQYRENRAIQRCQERQAEADIIPSGGIAQITDDAEEGGNQDGGGQQMTRDVTSHGIHNDCPYHSPVRPRAQRAYRQQEKPQRCWPGHCGVWDTLFRRKGVEEIAEEHRQGEQCDEDDQKLGKPTRTPIFVIQEEQGEAHHDKQHGGCGRHTARKERSWETGCACGVWEEVEQANQQDGEGASIRESAQSWSHRLRAPQPEGDPEEQERKRGHRFHRRRSGPEIRGDPKAEHPNQKSQASNQGSRSGRSPRAG